MMTIDLVKNCATNLFRCIVRNLEGFLSDPPLFFGWAYYRRMVKECYGTYQHGNGLFLLNIYRFYLTLGKRTPKQSGAYAQHCARRLAGMLFFYQCVDLVGCVLIPVAVGQGAPWLAPLDPQGAGYLGSDPSLGGVWLSPGVWGTHF